tara:strand:+ start:42576 stop:42905 length:330 start_codon:yes stop_codon:yes gene_type:complete
MKRDIAYETNVYYSVEFFVIFANSFFPLALADLLLSHFFEGELLIIPVFFAALVFSFIETRKRKEKEQLKTESFSEFNDLIIQKLYNLAWFFVSGSFFYFLLDFILNTH